MNRKGAQTHARQKTDPQNTLRLGIGMALCCAIPGTLERQFPSTPQRQSPSTLQRQSPSTPQRQSPSTLQRQFPSQSPDPLVL
jgi:hypothetical protein